MNIERAFIIGMTVVGFGFAVTSAEALTAPKQHRPSNSIQRSTFWVEHEKKPKLHHAQKAKKHAIWHRHAKSHHKLAKKD